MHLSAFAENSAELANVFGFEYQLNFCFERGSIISITTRKPAMIGAIIIIVGN